MSDEPVAFVSVDPTTGKPVVDSAFDRGVIAAIDETNAREACRQLFRKNIDRVRHFVHRMGERGDDPAEMCVIMVLKNDPVGSELLDVIMPDHDWDQYARRGQTPMGKGIADREIIQYVLDMRYPSVGNALRAHQGIAVVVIAEGGATVYKPEGP